MGRLDSAHAEANGTPVYSRRGFFRYFKRILGRGRRSGRFRINEAARTDNRFGINRGGATDKHRAD
jgi:hypothetical protein